MSVSIAAHIAYALGRGRNHLRTRLALMSAQRNAGHRCVWLQAFLDDLRFEGLGLRGSLAHGDPLVEAKNGIHLNR